MQDRSLFIFNFKPNEKYQINKKHIFAFLIFFCLTFILLEGINRYVFVGCRAELYKHLNKFINEKDQIEIVFLGDSHVADAIVPEYFKNKAFVLEYPGTNYIMFYYLLKHYIGQMPKLKMVVLEVDYNNFSSYRSNAFRKFEFWNKFLDYNELVKIKGPGIILNKFKNITILDEELGRMNFFENIMVTLVSKEKWQHIKESWPYNIEPTPVERAKLHFKNSNPYDKDLILYYLKILELCKKNNILLLALHLPLSNEYSNEASKYVNIPELKHKLFLSEPYSEYIYKYFDYEKLYENDQALFKSNGDHITSYAAAMFSQMLAQEIAGVMRDTVSNNH